mgnify:CR=1 FL=1
MTPDISVVLPARDEAGNITALLTGIAATLQDRAHEINQRAGELAREAAEQFADGRARWVIGDIGPGTKLPSLGHTTYAAIRDAYLECVIDGM